MKSVAVALTVLVSSGALRAATLSLPNASFESPATEIVDPRIDAWQKLPMSLWWNEAEFGPWDQLVGGFANPPPGDPRHIDNCDGKQAIWVFASPGAGLFQDYDSFDWSSPTPSHAFNARFQTGKSYQLTVGLLVGTVFPMPEGATLELSLYYRDAASNRVTVAAVNVTNTPNVFSNGTHLIDFQVSVPPVKASDAWAGQNIGIQIMSTVLAPSSGYWDVDHVRLTETGPPRFVDAAMAAGPFRFTLESEPGLQFEMLASADPTRPLAEWTSLGTVTNLTGLVSFTDPTAAGAPRRFYQARQLP